MTVIGIDVGGTFTDLILLDPSTGEVRIAKSPTTVENQAHGVMRVLAEADVDLARAETIVHGTTTTTNALLERKIARVGLITTQGFRDVLELGRRTRPKPYGLLGTFEPLIPRTLRLEVPERMDVAGEVVTPLDEAAVAEAVDTLKEAGCEALVIHFLHSYVNPDHERRAAEIARARWPEAHVTAGHAILSEYREYERGTTAVVNAAVQPILHRYIDSLRGALEAGGYRRDLLVMRGNGGTVSSRIVAETAVNTVMSGPASGVMAAAACARSVGCDRLITYDMGGTSSDVGLVLDGVPGVTSELELEYAMPIHVPMVDVHSIGAGGGSIAHVDDAGILQVGPESAGADPGPICYARGGTRPTITDANLVLGRLDPEGLLAVDAPVSVASVEAAIMREIGGPLGLDGAEAAAAILQIANNRMAGAIRLVSLERGHDPRDFVLYAFGGAGPLHAVALARELAVPRVLIPARPGVTNALGCAIADIRHDFVRTVNSPLGALDIDRARQILDAQIAAGKAAIEREQVAVESIHVLHSADMQFRGQSHILSVPLDDADLTVDDLQRRFDSAYWERFKVELKEVHAVLVNLHTVVIGRRANVPLEILAGRAQKSNLDEALRGRRPVWFESGWVETPIYRREWMPAKGEVEGPAVIEQLDATTVLEPGNKAVVDEFGNLIVEVGG